MHMMWRLGLAILIMVACAANPLMAQDRPDVPDDGIYAALALPIPEERRTIDPYNSEVTHYPR